jgi:hypothetical protein
VTKAAEDKPPARPRYRIEPVDLGGLLIPDVVDISEVLLVAEGDDR